MSTLVYPIAAGDYENGGAASRELKEQLKRVGADPAVVRKAMIAAYEAEMNVVIHSEGGELRAQLDNGRLDVEVVDRGPGIADLEEAQRPGFSTASARAREMGFGAGMGLPNIKKNSERFAIESRAGAGTTVRFSIALRPPTLYGTGGHSIRVSPDACQGCFKCVHACPTRAVRVFRGRPQILDYLCVDCIACLTSCPAGALHVESPAELPAGDGRPLVVTAACLAQFGPDAPPQRVLAELAALGYAEVHIVAAWEAALRAAVREYAQGAAAARPVLAPTCAAVLNLVETRFPSLLPNVAPFLSPIEALAAELHGRDAAFVVSCPCQRTVALESGHASVYAPAALRKALLSRLQGKGALKTDTTGASAPTRSAETTAEGVLRVSGPLYVLRVLEQIENGRAEDLSIVEPFMCDEAGFGTPLLPEDPFLARHRWDAAALPPDGAARAIRREQPLAARPGLRLDEDMSKAIQKLARIDRLTRDLPGANCGLCGAPTCAALAEDIVLGRAATDACVRQKGLRD